MKHKYITLLVLAALLLFQACAEKEADPGNPNRDTGPVNPAAFSESGHRELETSLPGHLSEEDLASYFSEYDNAAMILSDGISEICYNRSFAMGRHSPFSTFKVPNTLIALEEGVVHIDDSLRSWDGTVYNRPELNQDQDLASAMKHSCVWYYQQLAREVSADAMKYHLAQIGYGNEDISGGIDTFWLSSTIEISPLEQLDFIRKLYYNDLPFSPENIAYVKSILKQEDYPIDLYGKTGSSGRGEGWFIGYAQFDNRPYFFAVYAEGKGVSGLQIRDLTARILSDCFLSQ